MYEVVRMHVLGRCARWNARVQVPSAKQRADKCMGPPRPRDTRVGGGAGVHGGVRNMVHARKEGTG